MGAISTYAKNAIVDHILSVSALSFPADVYLGIGTAPGVTGVTEHSGDNYSRVTMPDTSWSAASGRAISNSVALVFPTATGSWGTPTGWAVYDAASGGNCLAYGAISNVLAIGSGDAPKIAIGGVELSWAGSSGNTGWSSYLVHKVLEHITGKTSYTAESLYVGFSTASFTDTGAITGEASGGGYARTATGAFGAAVAGNSSNSADIDFTTSGNWTASLITVFVANHATNSLAANLLCFGAISSMSPLSGEVVDITTGSLVIGT